MEKQTIKLKESQLRQMIKEALNELDWKTYANAAKKQADVDGEYKLSHDKPNRAYKFNLAASNEFNKKHGHNGNYTDDFRRLGAAEPTNWGTTELPKLHLVANDLCDIENGFLCRDFNDSDKSYYVNKGNNGRVKQTKKIPSKTLGNHPELMQKFKDAEKEMEHYYNGDYDYTQDKGWHLKESQLRNFIKENIKKVLKEGESIVEFNNLDAIFNEKFGDTVRISRFYSDVNNVVVAVQRQVYGTIAKKVTSIMDEFGYTLSDVGANGEAVMMTFGVANNAQNEPVASTINESKLINMIKESIKKYLK